MHDEAHVHPPGCPHDPKNMSKPVEVPNPAVSSTESDNYTPLIVVFLFIFILTIIDVNLFAQPNVSEFLMSFEGYFFVLFALFKLVDLKSFASGFSNYDLIAKNFYGYGYVYPFIELILGICFLARVYMLPAIILTIVVSVIGGLGVLIELRKNRKIKCACLGSVINLPLSTISFIEYGLMGLMALYMLLTI